MFWSSVDQSVSAKSLCLAVALSFLSGAAQAAELPQFYGPGSCSAQTCHGSTVPRADERINQNEYAIWSGAGDKKDAHAQAHTVLTRYLSDRMAKTIGLGKASEAPRCLACHELSPPPEQRGRAFALGDGVSCESCHGASSMWLGPHASNKMPYEEKLKLGLHDMKDLANRAERCLSCHVGTKDKFVDHELIAAGHPDLSFELATFTVNMPPHWKKVATPLEQVKMWAIGQAVQLKVQMERVADRAKHKIWPEYAELDCAACHHSLTSAKDSWRQAGGYKDRQSGNIQFNNSRYVVLKKIAAAVGGGGGDLDSTMSKVFTLMSKVNPDKGDTASAAETAAKQAAGLLPALQGATFDAALVKKLMNSISSDGETLAPLGRGAAEQVFWALQLLTSVASQSGDLKKKNDLEDVLKDMGRHVGNVSDYKAPTFAELMKRYNGLLN